MMACSNGNEPARSRTWRARAFRRPFTAFLFGALASAVGCGEHVPVAVETSGTETRSDGSASGSSDASATDSTPAYDPTVCPAIPTCAAGEAHLVDAPAGITFLVGGNARIAGKDSATNELVVYAVGMVDGVELRLVELRRFPATYDRILLSRDGFHLDDREHTLVACEALQCEAYHPRPNSPRAILPAELAPRWISEGCVAGAGLGCLDAAGNWTWELRPESLAHPIVRFTRLGDDSVVALDDQGTLLRVNDGVVASVSTGMSSPIAELSGGYWQTPMRWLAVTRDSQVIFGNAGTRVDDPGAIVGCGQASAAWTSARTELAHVHDRKLTVVSRGCHRYDVPFDPLGFGRSYGDEDAHFVFDAHRMLAEANVVWTH